VWQALLEQDLGASAASRLLLFLRGYGARALRSSGGTFPERLERFGFTKLDEDPGRELVFGIAGRFWRWNGDLRRIPDRAAFVAFAEEGCVRGAWNLAIGAVSEDGCELSTETRIEYFGDVARRKFRLYWSVVGPFSGILRRALLRGIRRRAEAPSG
jgi:hypothetical protein